MATYENKLIVLTNGKLQKISSTDDLEIGGSLKVGGDLEVLGDIIAVGLTNVIVSDPFLSMAIGNVSSGQAAGFAFNIAKTSGASTYSVLSVYANNSGQYVRISGNHASEFSDGQIFQLSGMNVGSNNGLFAVSDSNYDAGDNKTYIYVRTSGSIPNYVLFLQSSLTSETPDAGLINRVDLGVLSMSGGTGLRDANGNTFAAGTLATAFATDATINDFAGGDGNPGYTEIATGGSVGYESYYQLSGVTSGSILAIDRITGWAVPADAGYGPNSSLRNVLGVAVTSTLTNDVVEYGGLTLSGQGTGALDGTLSAIWPGTWGNTVRFGITGSNTGGTIGFSSNDGISITGIFKNGECTVQDIIDTIQDYASNSYLPFFVSGTGPNYASLDVSGVTQNSTLGNAQWVVTTTTTHGYSNGQTVKIDNVNASNGSINSFWTVTAASGSEFALIDTSGSIEWNSGGDVWKTLVSGDNFALTGFTGATGSSVSGSELLVMTQFGKEVSVLMNGQEFSNRSTPVFLGSNGHAVLTAPESGRVYRLGITTEPASNNTRSVIFQPMFIADND